MTNIYIRHGEDFQLLGVYHKAISIMKNVWKLRWKSVIRAEKEQPIEISVLPTSHWVTIEKQLSIMKNIWKLQWKSVIGAEKDESMQISVTPTNYWVTIEKPLSIMKNTWKLQ